MIYTFKYNDATLEFVGNKGKAIVKASDEANAIITARRLFAFMRDEVASLDENEQNGQYEVRFKVSLDYQQSILRRIDRVINMIRGHQDYSNARPLERYLIVSMKLHCGNPTWLEVTDPIEEARKQRQDAVVSRDLRNISEFLDWDICLHNYIELNSRHRHRSHSIRNTDDSS